LKKNKFLSLIVVFLFAFNALSDFKSDIKINSNSIEFLKESKKINFFDSVEINSKYEKIWPKRSFIKECDSRIIAKIFAIIKEYMKTSKRLKFFIMNRI